MKAKSTFAVIAFCVAILSSSQITNAQNTSPFWSLAGNNNASTNSKLGTTNAIPLRLTTNNKARVFIDATGKVGVGTTTPGFTLDVLSTAGGTSAYAVKIQGAGQTGVLRLQNTNASGWNAADFFDNTGVLKAGVGFGNANVSGPFARRAYLTSLGTDPLVLGTNNSVRLFVDGNSGNVGIGNTSPVNGGLIVDKVVGNTNAIFGSNTTGIALISNFPSIGFNAFFNGGWKNLATGFAGNIFVDPTNGSIQFANTATSQSAGATTPLVNRMIIANNGFVGIGTNAPGALLGLGDPLDNEGLFMTKSGFNTGAEFIKTNTSSTTVTLNVANDGLGDGIEVVSAGGNGIVATANGTAGVFAGFFNGDVFSTGAFLSSDEKLKQNIHDFNSAMNIINELHPKLYQFKKDGNYALMHLPQGEHYGLIAQEVEKVLPNLVKQTKFDTRISKHAQTEKSSPADVVDFKALNYTELIPIIIKALQEQQSTIEALKQQVQQLQGSSSGSQNANAASVSSASLEQNIPNPLNTTTTIHYTLPAGSSKAVLNIIDNNGNSVKQIPLNSNGKGVVNIEASTLRAGTYSYSLIVDGKTVATKKMVVTR